MDDLSAHFYRANGLRTAPLEDLGDVTQTIEGIEATRTTLYIARNRKRAKLDAARTPPLVPAYPSVVVATCCMQKKFTYG